MFFKKSAGTIFGVHLNATEQKVLDAEIAKQVVAVDRQYEIDRESQILWMLHEQFNFGPIKLYRAWKRMYADSKELQARYEMGPNDGGWLCRQKLKDMGVDIERWYQDEVID